MKTSLIVGNWKMNVLASEAAELARGIGEIAEENKNVHVVLAPSFTSLHAVKQALQGGKVSLGCQNFYYQEKGAFTGEVSADMIKEAGCQYAILGHSERRQLFGETDELVNKKIICAVQKDISAIFCVGETKEQRANGQTFEVVESQLEKGLAGLTGQDLKKVFIAYEPIWAIGTGENATADQAAEVHRHIRKIVKEKFSADGIGPLTILYGGSVTSNNCEGLLQNPEIDGALVGGASLNIDSFCDIIRSAQKA